jgi:hypothetical protein
MLIRWLAEVLFFSDFFVRVDEDVYLRPAPLLEQLVNRVPVGYYWGGLSYLTPVNRTSEVGELSRNMLAQFLEDDDVDLYPLYMRGPLFVISMDLVHKIVARYVVGNLQSYWSTASRRNFTYGRIQRMQIDEFLCSYSTARTDLISAHLDDTSLGLYLLQLVTSGDTFVNVDDRDENRISFNPRCEHKFSKLTRNIWAIHQ